MNLSVGLPALLAISLTSTLAWALSPTEPPKFDQNASFLSRRFLTDSKNAAALTDDFVPKADRLYAVHVLFPNGGLLGATGALDHAPFAAKIFLDHVTTYERANKAAFTLMPYLNGYSPQDTAHGANLRLDLDNRLVRAQIVTECTRYVSASIAGSYVAGAARPFDGIVLDLEPAGDPTFLASLKSLVGEIRAAFDAMGLKNKKIGIAAPQYTDKLPKPNWGWDSSNFFNMARAVNFVVAMTYDSGLMEESKY